MTDLHLLLRRTARAAVQESLGRSDNPNGLQVESRLQPILNLWALLRRRMRLVLVVTAGTLAITAYKLYRDPLVYRATAVVRLSDERRSLSRNIGGEAEENATGAGNDLVLSQIQLLRSRAVASAVVGKEGLRLQPLSRHVPAGLLTNVYVDSSAAPDTFELHFSRDGIIARSPSSTVRVAYGTPLKFSGVRFTIAADPGVQRVRLAVVPSGQAVNALLANLVGEPRQRTDIIYVHYTATDPLTAQRVVNSTVQEFQALSARMAQQRSTRRRVFIEGQLAKSDSLLQQAQRALDAFRSRKRVYSSQERLRAQQTDLTALEVRIQELTTDRAMYQSLLTALKRRDQDGTSAERLSAVVASPGIAASAPILELYQQLVDYQTARDSLTTGTWASPSDHPDVKRLDALIASTEGRIAGAVRGQIASLDARLAAMRELASRSAAEMASLPHAEGEQTRLVERTEVYRRMADRLREQLQEAQIEEAVEAGQVEVVDLADLPPSPIGMSRTMKLVIGLLIGLFLGGGGAYLVENSSGVLRRKEDLEAALRVPTLTLVPPIRLRNSTGDRSSQEHDNAKESARDPTAELVTVSDLRSSGAEAYRTLRTNLLFSTSVQSLRRIVVTSAGPREGKTTTSANLAVAFAQQGYRVLLLDCDLRRARLHRLFQMPRRPGLTEVLQGRSVPAEAIKSTPVERLFVLPAGASLPSPSELLGSVQMRSALDALSQTFDLILLDTPPLCFASDAAIVSKLADGVLILVRAGHTEREAAQQAIQQLTVVGARVLGTVLNDPDAEAVKYGAYYRRYGYSYH